MVTEKKRSPVPGKETVPPAHLSGFAERKYDERGYEIMDDRPLQPPIGYHRQPSLSDQIRQMVRSEALAREAEQSGLETFEEADDFDIGDDYDPRSPYEDDFDPQEAIDPADPSETISAAVERGVSRAFAPASKPTDNNDADNPPTPSHTTPAVGGAEGGSKATPPSEPPPGTVPVRSHFRRFTGKG